MGYALGRKVIDSAMDADSQLKKTLHIALNNAVLNDNKPILGICVGMQIMGDTSQEGAREGLGWINIRFNKFNIKH